MSLQSPPACANYAKSFFNPRLKTILSRVAEFFTLKDRKARVVILYTFNQNAASVAIEFGKFSACPV